MPAQPVAQPVESRVVVSGLYFPESPRLVGRELWFVDGPTVNRVVPGEPHRVHVRLPEPFALGLVVHDDGSGFVVGAHERRVYSFTTGGELAEFADLTAYSRGPVNDLVECADGALYAGCMGFDLFAGEGPRPSRLARLEPDASARSVGPEVVFPNGIALSPDGARLLVAESAAARIAVTVIEPDGSLTAQEPIRLPEGAEPDGICLGDDGTVWYADVRQGYLAQVTLSGEQVRRLDLSINHATSCIIDQATQTMYVTGTQQLGAPDTEPAPVASVVAVDLAAIGR